MGKDSVAASRSMIRVRAVALLVRSNVRTNTRTMEKRWKGTSNAGFTLLEVLIATVIMAVALLAMAQMQVIAIRANAQGKDVTEARTLGTQHLEYLKALPVDHADLTAGTHNPGNPINGKYTRTRTVVRNVDYWTVTVQITWLSGPQRIPREVRFSTAGAE